jgi:hypothetical protein
MDVDLEEMALTVAERRNVSNPDGELGSIKYFEQQQGQHSLPKRYNKRIFILAFSIPAENQAEANSERRLKNIVARRKLVDLAKAQAQEVAILRAEVERLRMRTFPALVQVDP